MNSENPKRQRGRLLRDLAYVPALLATVVVVCLFYSAEKTARVKFEQDSREEVFAAADKNRAQLSLQLNTHAMLVRGMVASFAARPDMSDQEFQELAGALLDQGSLLRAVAAAPDMVLRMIHPADRPSLLGLDIRKSSGIDNAAMKQIVLDGLQIQGPFKPDVGGAAVAIRVPVFEWQDPGNKVLWGLVTALVDFEELLAQTELGTDASSIRAALFHGPPAVLETATPFFGDAAVLRGNPVLLDMQLPGLEWTLAAIPAKGWPVPEQVIYLRSGFALLALLALVPLIISAQLYRENFDHLETLKGREQELRSIWRRYRLALDASDVGVWDYDFDSGHLRADRRLRDLLGGGGELPHGDLSTWMENVPKVERQKVVAGIRDALAAGNEHRATFSVALPDGQVRHLRMIVAPARHHLSDNEKGALDHGQVIGLCWDVTDDIHRAQKLERAHQELLRRNKALEEAHARIEEAALTDSLTGLANRRSFEMMRQNRADKENPLDGVNALLLLDLDGFKEVNDRLGHPSGDQLLIRVGEVLRRCTGGTDLVARIGGDEFAVMLQGSKRTPAAVTTLARKIGAEILKASREIGAGSSSGCSVGLARPGIGGHRMAELFASADYALYCAKQQAAGKLAEYTESLHQQRNQRSIRNRELRTAALTHQFEVCYQPRYLMRDQSVSRLEALVRWRHPERGLLTPSEFMEDLIEMGLSVRIDRFVMGQVAEDLAAWEKMGLNIASVSVNISAQRLADEDLLSDLSKLGPARERLVLELLEAIDFSADGGALMENVMRLRKMGIALEIDDFGTGHASPLNMLRLRPEGIKIARELIAPIVQSDESLKLVEALVALGRSLDIRVTVEGVETAEHIRVLSHMAIDELQGFALGRPMTFAQVAQDPGVKAAFSNKIEVVS